MATVEKLRGRENYATWAIAMRRILIREGSWPAVSRTPGDVVSEDLKDLALATICLCVESSIIGLIEDAEDPKETWEKLEASFQEERLPRETGQLRSQAWFGADTMDGVCAGGWYADSGVSCHMTRTDQDFDGKKSLLIFSEKTCTVLEGNGYQVASGEEELDLNRMDKSRKANQSSATSLSTSKAELIAKEGVERTEMAFLVTTAEQPPREKELVAVDSEPDVVATGGPVARDEATEADSREAACHALPSDNDQKSCCRGEYEGASSATRRLLYIRQKEFASVGLYVACFMGAAHDPAENGFEVGNWMIAILLQ